MCGIFGVLSHVERVAPHAGRLRDTATRMQHRGPDGHGIHAAAGVGLVHTRLSLVDLSDRSAQPFWDRSGRYCLVYNGELYDYQELRETLADQGVAFRTTSDTEVLLEALLAFGVAETLQRIDGMFAFCLHDRERNSFVLARDRFGIKPLFYHEDATQFVFASSVDAMRPWIAFEPDRLMLSAFLQGFNGPTSGHTFYRDVHMLSPGAILEVEPGAAARISQCLTMGDLVDHDMRESFASWPRRELVDRMESLLLESVESQLCADVPVGAFCSGGVDSSLILSMAARSHKDLRIYHADIVGPLSERSAAEQLSRHLGLELKAVEVGDARFIDTLPHVLRHYGAPFVNATLVPVMMVSRLVNACGTKAVLTGEASDELFLGYEWLAPDVRARIRRLPGKLLGKLGLRRKASPEAERLRDVESVYGFASRFENAMGPVMPEGAPHPYHVPGCNGLGSDPNLSYILRTLLFRNDTMGMAASVESRFPFLDARVVRASVNLPYDCKIRFSPFTRDTKHPFYTDKWIVRQIASRYLPAELSHRQKGMFPTSAFQRMQVENAFFEGGFLAQCFELPRRPLERVLAHAGRSLRHRLLMAECWGAVCMEARTDAALSERLSRFVRVTA